MICISNRGLAGGLASHHCWPSTGRGAIRRGASRGGYAGISGCAAEGEPRPLRLAPLHMDVHAGNIIHNESGLRLIDWEYAGDGDIALELAAVWITPGERRRLVEAYARRAAIDAQLLWRQVALWRPWVLLLMAGWYEMRWRQSGDRQFITLADEIWCQLDNERKG